MVRGSCRWLVFVLCFLTTSAQAAVIFVNAGPGTPLQDAINAASPGDTIRASGHFTEAIVIDKPLTLKPVRTDLYSHVTLDAGCASPVAVDVRSGGVSILGLNTFDRRFFIENGTMTDLRVLDASRVKVINVVVAGDGNSACGHATAIEVVNSNRVKLGAGIGACGFSASPNVGIYVHDLVLSSQHAGIHVTKFLICVDSSGTGLLFQNIGPSAQLADAGIKISKGMIGANGDGIGAFGVRLVQASGLVVSGNVLDGTADSVLVDSASDNSTFKGNTFATDAVDQGQGNCWIHNTGAGAFPTTCP